MANQDIPLAHLLRPNCLKDFLGQKSIIENTIRPQIKSNTLKSMIFWGNPGTGKTTLALILAKETQRNFHSFNASRHGKKDFATVLELKTSFDFDQNSLSPIIFIDEIHRLTKAQQDYLLSFVESGQCILLGATTETPSYELNSSLLSRLRVLRFKNHDLDSMLSLVNKVKQKKTVDFEDEFSTELNRLCSGDLRMASNYIELCLERFPEEKNYTKKHLLSKDIIETIQNIYFDKNSSQHYNLISALIKSVRNSDPQAAQFYLARALLSGEDPKYLVRRLIVLSSEDIGNADPRAFLMATATKTAVEFVGMPECRINLSQLVNYLALAPKSNASYLAINKAMSIAKQNPNLPIPKHILNANNIPEYKELDYGIDYSSIHDNAKSAISKPHLPAAIAHHTFYEPKNVGYEKYHVDKIKILKENKNP